MHRKVIPCTILFLLVALSPLFSENKAEIACTIKGMAIDSTSTETIPYVTVSVSTAATPDVYLKRIAGNAAGVFEMPVSKSGNYLVTIESVGMQKKLLNVTVATGQKKVELGKIALSTSGTQLKGVTVSAAKPLVKVDLDKITYDIKSDPESQSSNTLDMLRKVPMVTVDGDDKIQLKGSSNFKIYMNGKPSGMTTNNPSQVLKSIPASSIKSIEVITEPGAKYDAEGIGGIINIVTDHSLSGLTGTVRGGADNLGGYNGGLYLSTKIGKFGLTTNLNYNNHHQPGQVYLSEKENYNSTSTKYITQYANSDARYKFYYGNLEASYEFDSLNLVSFTMGGYQGGSSSTDDAGTYSMAASRDTLSAFKQLTKSQDGWGGIDLTLDYQRSFKKPDQLFTLSYKMSHTPQNTDNTTDLTGVLNYTGYNEHIKFDAKGDEHTFQADYTEPFNKRHVLEIGAKYILRLNTSVNSYMVQNGASQLWEPSPTQPVNNLDQTQNILGAYGSYALKLKKFSFRAGVRYEQTWSNVNVTDTSFNVKFKNLVPAISVNYKFNDASNIRFSYNQRISRPSIWYLNPFLDNSNPFSLTQGNPDLKPEIDNSFALNYSYVTPKLNINTNAFTSFTNNSIETVRRALNDTVIYNTYKNIGLNQTAGFSLYGNWTPAPWVRINLNGNAAYTSLTTNDGSGLKNTGTNYSVSGGGQFTLPHELKLNLNGGYYSPRIQLQGQNSAFYYYGVSASRDLLNKKLNISLYLRNPFKETSTRHDFSQTTDYRVNNTNTYIARAVGFSLTYRFGEMKNQIKKVERTITNDDVKGGGGQGGGGQ